MTLGLCRLLYNYSTSDTSDIYNLVLQDPERIRDDYYYRSRKKRLMEAIKDRFGDLVRTQRGRHREERFLPQADSQKYASLVKECLTRFTPWRSACVLPNELDPKIAALFSQHPKRFCRSPVTGSKCRHLFTVGINHVHRKTERTPHRYLDVFAGFKRDKITTNLSALLARHRSLVQVLAR